MKGKYYMVLLQLVLLFSCKSNKTYNFNAEGVYGAFFNERTEYVYAGKGNGELLMYDKSLAEISRQQLDPGPVSTCITSPDGNYLVNTCVNGHLYIWDVSQNTFNPVYDKQLHNLASWTCLFSPGQNYVVSTGADSVIVVLSWPELNEFSRIRSGSGAIRFGWFSHDEKDLLWVTEGGYVVRMELASGLMDSAFVAPSALNCVVSDNQKENIVTAADDGNFYILDYNLMNTKQVVTAHNGAAYVAEFWDNPTTKIASCGADGTIKTWVYDDVAAAYILDNAVVAHRGVSCTLYYNSKGNKLLSGGQDGWVKIWDAGTLELLNSVSTTGR